MQTSKLQLYVCSCSTIFKIIYLKKPRRVLGFFISINYAFFLVLFFLYGMLYKVVGIYQVLLLKDPNVLTT